VPGHAVGPSQSGRFDGGFLQLGDIIGDGTDARRRAIVFFIFGESLLLTY